MDDDRHDRDRDRPDHRADEHERREARPSDDDERRGSAQDPAEADGRRQVAGTGAAHPELFDGGEDQQDVERGGNAEAGGEQADRQGPAGFGSDGTEAVADRRGGRVLPARHERGSAGPRPHDADEHRTEQRRDATCDVDRGRRRDADEHTAQEGPDEHARPFEDGGEGVGGRQLFGAADE